MTRAPMNNAGPMRYLRVAARRSPVIVGLAVAWLILSVGLIVMFSSASSAQDDGNGVEASRPSVVTGVDASSPQVEISVLRDGYSIPRSDVVLTEAGSEVEAMSMTTARELGRPVEVVYVLDVDNRTMAGGVLGAMAAAVLDSVDDLPPGVKFGLVAAGEQADLRTRLTSDPGRLKSDLQALTASRGASLYDAIGVASAAFSDRTEGAAGVVRSVVVVSGGPDTASKRSTSTVESELIQTGAQVIWVSRGEGDGGLAELVDRSGGTTLALPDIDLVGPVMRSATTAAADRLLISYPGTAQPGQRADVTLDLAGERLDLSYPAGVDTVTKVQLAPREVAETNDLGFFGRPIILYLSVGLSFLAVSTALWALGSMFAGGETSLDKVLARYSDRDETLDDDEVQEMLVQTALVRRAIDMTESFADRRGFLTRMEDLLERANLPVRAGEALFFLGAIVVVAFGLVSVVTGSPLVAGVVALIGSMGGFAAVHFIASRRLKQFEAQLPDALQLLAGTLRAGYSLPQGLDAVSTEISDPMGHELRRAITETQLGREMEDALAAIAERLDSEDFAWAVMAIGIQREVGGNLSELLMTVSETMIQRERLHREVNALTAEGRVSAGILSMLPPGLGLVMWVMNPDYLSVLFDRTIGLILLGLAVVAGLIGLAWMKKVVTIDV